MKYQVRLTGGNLGAQDKVVFETEQRSEAIAKMVQVRRLRNDAPYNNYDSVKVFKGDECTNKIDLY